VIVEQVPGESLKIQTADGSVFVYGIDEVEKMTKEIAEKAEPESARPTGSKKSPGAAVGWSLGVGLFTLDGAGQFYNGEVGKGFLYLLWSFTGNLMIVLGTEDNSSYYGDIDDDDGLIAIGAISRVTSFITAAVDASKSAKRINLERGYTTAIEPAANSLHLGLAPESKGRGGMLAFTHRM
jgi:TM2 domain-containing membrane protein YozV